MDQNREDSLSKLQRKLKVSFENQKLLTQALTHSSYAYEHNMSAFEHNERLEYLGDAVLGLIIAEAIFKKFPDAPEGKLAKARSYLVCERALANIAKELQLGSLLQLGRGELQDGGRTKKSLLANAVEALFGAIYLDKGWIITKKIVLNIWKPLIKEVIEGDDGALIRDAKSELQEKIQLSSTKTPLYHLVKTKGPDHAKVFISEVRHDNKVLGVGSGKTKKDSEQEAAKKALQYLKKRR